MNAIKLKAAREHRLGGRMKEALALYAQVLQADPENLDALMNLARMSLDLGRLEAAASMVLRALSRAPQESECEEILGQVVSRFEDPVTQGQVIFEYAQDLKAKGFWDSALVHYRRALRFDPSLASSDNFESITLLAQGQLTQGWQAFEWRNTVASLGPFTDKVWNGEDLTDKTLLVWGEQGIGDQIMFSTCLPDIIACAGHVIFGVDERLVSLFARSFPKASVHGVSRYWGGVETRVNDFDWLGDYPAVDFFVLEGSLPRFYRPTIESFPATSCRLTADPEQVKYWRQKLAGLGVDKKVGISWRSFLVSEDNADHYPAFELWQPLFDKSETRFISLQAGITQQEQLLLKERFGLTLTVYEELDLIECLDGTASLIASLDAVVTTQNYLQWLGASLGVPTWSIARGNRKTQWGFLGQRNYPWFPDLNVCLEEDDNLLVAAFARVAGNI